MLRFLRDRRGGMADTAISLPVILLAALGMLNLSLASFAAVIANNAANYGARRGSVAQTDPIGAAVGAASGVVDRAHVGAYEVNAAGGGGRGRPLQVTVHWSAPNYFAGLASLFGAGGAATIEGDAIAVFRQEGW